MNDATLTDWPRVEALFAAALERPPTDRAAFLDTACADAPALRTELARLLDAHARAEGYLDTLDAGHVAALVESVHEAPIEDPLIGPYRIVGELGRGGMGVVYRAERADGTFEKAVALKLVKRGTDTDEVLARFQRERRILAGLDHPGIARLLDAGAAPDGRPFLVMELVEGELITAYCDRKGLGVDARLALFERACEAVQHAHRRLVVHRDLKPSNVLVADGDDGAPRVKLLDFGIARLLDPDADEHLTQTGVRRLTPGYAAPEQLRGEAVTTATDVYALGVILFELLTGERNPSPLKPPSAVVDGERLRRRLRGDLDTLVVKALQEDPADRYPSVEALLDDLRRHRAGLPLHARPASAGYRVRKFVQRHRTGVAATALVVLALLLGLGTTTWQAREKAREAARADRARDFALSLFDLADPINTVGQAVTTEDLLDWSGERALLELNAEPEVQEEALLALAAINHRLSRYDEARAQYTYVRAQREARLGPAHPGVAEAVSGLANIASDAGDLIRADSLFRRALAVQRSGDDPLALARTLYGYGALARRENDLIAAEARHREALALRRRHAGPQSPEVAESLKGLALLQHQRDARDKAEALYREALALQVSLSGEAHPEVGRICNSLASLLRTEGRYTEADSLYRRALAAYRQAYPGDSRPVVTALAQWSGLLVERGQPEPAQAQAEEACAMARRLFGDQHSMVALATNALASALAEQERYAEAIALQEKVVALYEGGAGPEHPSTGYVLINLAQHHLERGDVAAAKPLYERSRSIMDAALAPGHTDRGRALLGLGRVALAQGRPAEAETFLREALAIREAQLGTDHPHTAEIQTWLGACLAAQGRRAEAAPLMEASARYARGEARQSIQRAIRTHLATNGAR